MTRDELDSYVAQGLALLGQLRADAAKLDAELKPLLEEQRRQMLEDEARKAAGEPPRIQVTLAPEGVASDFQTGNI